MEEEETQTTEEDEELEEPYQPEPTESIDLLDDDEDSFLTNEEQDELKELKSQAEKDLVKKAELYVKIIELLRSLKEKETEDLNLIFIENFPELVSELEYLKANKFGSSIAKRRIENYANEKRKDINKLIMLFFKEYIEED